MALRERLLRGQHGVVGAALWVVFLVLALLDVEPIPTYYYALAWYSALLVVDAWVARLRGGSLLVDRPLALLCLFAWSLPFWLLFELLNLRLENWYYVGTPRDAIAGRVFLVVSFTTVLPALFEVYDLVRTLGWFERVRTPRRRVSDGWRRGLFAAGWAMLILSMALPTVCYPLVWGFLVLLLEPFNRRPGWPSLLRDLERGRPSRLLQLLAAGLLCGVYWEVMNMPARARWIYTVPFFDAVLGVEMPPLGFIGFLPFALAAYSFLRCVEILGLSIPFERDARGPIVRVPPAARVFALPPAICALCLVAIQQLEDHTVDARAPRTRDLPSLTTREAAILELDGHVELSSFLGAVEDDEGRREVARRLIAPTERIDRIAAEARLAELRGIGTANVRLLGALGIGDVASLAGHDADELYHGLRRLGVDAAHVRPQRVRVWVRGARAAN